MTFFKQVGLKSTQLKGERATRHALQRAENLEEFVKEMQAMERGARRDLLRAIDALPENSAARSVLDAFDVDIEAFDLRGKRIASLTPEQQAVVDWESNHGTLVVHGVAGSGKTAMAVARAVRKVREDSTLDGRYLLITYSKVLANACQDLVKQQFDGEMPANLEVMTHSKWLTQMVERLWGKFKIVDVLDLDMAPVRDEVEWDMRSFGEPQWFPDMEAEWGRFGSTSWKNFMKWRAEQPFDPLSSESSKCATLLGSSALATLERTGQTSMVLLSHLVQMLVDRRTDWCTGAEDDGAPLYREIIVDECQDLRLIDHETLAYLAGKQGIKLVLLGDTQQSIHHYDSLPEDYRMAMPWSDLDLVHDVIELKTNFRSPRSIEYQSRRVLQPDMPSEEVPQDSLCVLCKAPSMQYKETTSALVKMLLELAPSGGQIAIIGHEVDELKALVAFLRKQGVAVDYTHDNQTKHLTLGDDRVKVTTVQGAKGLEFDHVIGYRFEYGSFLGSRKEHRDYEAARESRRRMLHVVITRARQSVLFVSNSKSDGTSYLTDLLGKALDSEHVRQINNASKKS